MTSELTVLRVTSYKFCWCWWFWVNSFFKVLTRVDSARKPHSQAKDWHLLYTTQSLIKRARSLSSALVLWYFRHNAAKIATLINEKPWSECFFYSSKDMRNEWLFKTKGETIACCVHCSFCHLYHDNEHSRAFLTTNEWSSFWASMNNNARYDRPRHCFELEVNVPRPIGILRDAKNQSIYSTCTSTATSRSWRGR